MSDIEKKRARRAWPEKYNINWEARDEFLKKLVESGRPLTAHQVIALERRFGKRYDGPIQTGAEELLATVEKDRPKLSEEDLDDTSPEKLPEKPEEEPSEKLKDEESPIPSDIEKKRARRAWPEKYNINWEARDEFLKKLVESGRPLTAHQVIALERRFGKRYDGPIQSGAEELLATVEKDRPKLSEEDLDDTSPEKLPEDIDDTSPEKLPEDLDDTSPEKQ